MNISGKNFSLRHPKMSDLHSYHASKNDKEIANGFVTYTYPYSLEKAKIHLKENIKRNKSKNEEVLIIDVGNKAAGEIELEEIIPNLKLKISYWIGKEY